MFIRCELCEDYQEKRDSEHQFAVIKGKELLACKKCWMEMFECNTCHKFFEDHDIIFNEETGDSYCHKCVDKLNEAFNINMKEMRE